MARVELVLGGARSGKSRFAESRAQSCGKSLVYLATAEVRDGEMSERVKLHQQRRDDDWALIEEPLYLAKALIAHSSPDNCILVDCLTLWLTNALMQGGDTIDTHIWQAQKKALLEAVRSLPGDVIFVSNEVGQGVVPMGALSRRFVDEAGLLHQELAQRSDRVVFVTAGLPQLLKGSDDL